MLYYKTDALPFSSVLFYYVVFLVVILMVVVLMVMIHLGSITCCHLSCEISFEALRRQRGREEVIKDATSEVNL